MSEAAKYRFGIQMDYKPAPQGLVVFAFTVGDNINKNWDSNGASSISALNSLTDRVSGGRYITIAIPRIFGPYFTPTLSKYEKVSLPIAESSKSEAWSYGSYEIVLEDVSAVKIQQIYQWKGLPAPSQDLANYLIKKLGSEMTAPIAVTLFVQSGLAYIRG